MGKMLDVDTLVSALRAEEGLPPVSRERAPQVPDGRAPGFVPDVLVPLSQATVSALLVGLFAGIVADMFDHDGLIVGYRVAGLFAILAWGYLLVDTRRLLWSVEEKAGVDLDGDGHKGKPPKTRIVDRVLLMNARKGSHPGAPTPEDEEPYVFDRHAFVAFIRGIPAKGTAMRAWPGMSREQYTDFRDTLISSGVANWNSYGADHSPNTSQGWRLTERVEEILARVG